MYASAVIELKTDQFLAIYANLKCTLFHISFPLILLNNVIAIVSHFRLDKKKLCAISCN